VVADPLKLQRLSSVCAGAVICIIKKIAPPAAMIGHEIKGFFFIY
jgi:hypothetical protein